MLVYNDSNCITGSWSVAIQALDTMIQRLKCNVDAAVFLNQNSFGVGMCIRNDQVRFMQARNRGLSRQ